MKYYTEEFDKHGDYAFLKQQGGYFGVDPLPPAEDLHKAQSLHFFGSPFIVGSPEDAIRELTRAFQETGASHAVMEMQIEGMDPRLTEHSMRLFAKEVMPHFRAE